MNKLVLCLALLSISIATACGEVIEPIENSSDNINTSSSDITSDVENSEIPQATVNSAADSSTNVTTNSESELENNSNEEIYISTDIPSESINNLYVEESTLDANGYDVVNDTYIPEALPNSYYIDAEPVYQDPELPTGCEITALTNLLNYWGWDIDKEDLCANYLTIDYDYSTTFHESFIGNPWGNGFGCYSPVIIEAAERYLKDVDSSLNVYDLGGTDFEDLFVHIANDRPVLVWASMSLVDLNYYHVYTTSYGAEAWWYQNEHCMMLTGYDYDDRTVTVCDPQKGVYTYDMDRFNEIYTYLEQQAVTLW